MIIDTPAVNNVCNHLLSITLTYASFHKVYSQLLAQLLLFCGDFLLVIMLVLVTIVS